MNKTAIYRTAIVNKYNVVTYVSDVFFLNRDSAIKEIEKRFWQDNTEIKTHKWIEVCMTIANHDTWRTFEKIINEKNEGYIGIITEILVVE